MKTDNEQLVHQWLHGTLPAEVNAVRVITANDLRVMRDAFVEADKAELSFSEAVEEAAKGMKEGNLHLLDMTLRGFKLMKRMARAERRMSFQYRIKKMGVGGKRF